jgi:aspartate/methionine/tyrosine aminotransferase
MAERTVTCFSLSKSYALAGLRLGYVVADPRVLVSLRRLVNHGVYNVPVVLQRAGLAAIERAGDWLARARVDYRDARDLAHRLVPAPHHLPDGGAYLFLDLDGYAAPGEDGVVALHDRLLAAGLALAPGASFGSRFARHARLCYTAVPPERLAAGLARLASVLGTPLRNAGK